MKIEIPVKPDIHALLSIPLDKKLVVYSGSVGIWCGTEAIIEVFDRGYWDERFWLVFHTRKPLVPGDTYYDDLTRLHADPQVPFTLHPHPFDEFVDLATFLSGFDLALALYFPNYENPYYGRNLMEIGLSSGKFSTYMMLGIRTIATSCDMYYSLNKKYNFGAIINDINELKPVMREILSSEVRIFKLYTELLEPRKAVLSFIMLIENYIVSTRKSHCQ